MAAEQGMVPNELHGESLLPLVEAGIATFSERLRADIADSHPYVREATESYLSILEAGGKRIRGALTICAYEMHGGTDTTTASLAAGVIEGLHAYLLVLDDIEDKAPTRRGRPTAHVAMETFLRAHNATGDVHQSAADMVTSGALTGQHKAQVILTELDIPAERRLQAIASINQHLDRTGLGQILDMASTTGIPMTIKDIMSVALSKTAFYSFLMPLETGAILAGASEESLHLLRAYSLHAGVAFQLQDDIMGVFGDEQKMGKSVKSDIIEGKQTLLLAYALRASNEAQRSVLQHALGNAELTDEAFAQCQDIIIATGAVRRVREKARKQAQLAHKVLDGAPASWPSKNVNYLRAVASFAIDRDT